MSSAQGDKLLALKDMDTAIKLAPNDCMNHLVKGETLWSLSNTNGAMAEFNTTADFVQQILWRMRSGLHCDVICVIIMVHSQI